MTERSPLHVYLRSIERDERTSLSVLADLVKPGSRVLDLGTGSGALGRHLTAEAECAVDGVTINEQEAALARLHYRRVVVADLEQPGWAAALAAERYDFVVCADVLEHLRQPFDALEACRELLAPGGQLLISIPNVAYSGLVAGLLEGDFRYRDEGLLDRTHLRFFTRASAVRFLGEAGWSVDAIEPIERPLHESEFGTAFDRLPPAVSRYLLALPDASTYQFVIAARPAPGGLRAVVEGTAGGPAAALFSAQLYVGTGGGFAEDRKIVRAGVVGREHQVLHFPLPEGGAPISGLRLDPADRIGFLRLHRITLRAGADMLWQWRCEPDGLGALEGGPHQDLVMRSPWPGDAALMLLYGDDPQLNLPLPAAVLVACATRRGVVMEVEMGWPMSADYMALAESVRPLRQQLEASQVALAQAHDRSLALEQARLAALEEARNADALLASVRHGLEQDLQTTQRELGDRLASLQRQHRRLGEEKNDLSRELLGVQANQARLGEMYEALGAHLRWIEGSTVFRMTRPLVHAKIAFERSLGLRPPVAVVTPRPTPVAPPDDPVDVIVPVYRGLEDTRRCLVSVLASECSTPWRLIVLNDASPEPEVTAWLRGFCRDDSRILLLENEENLGFVATVNRGMAASDRHDVLLLNSDTEVANDWLDRIRSAAYSDARIASVTPFSNNATICSYPRFCEPNDLPPGCDTASLDALFAATNPGEVVDVPTGVGFCMYIRRDCLQAIGLFDVKNFGKGYGEENDFCRRAAEAGWRNLLALDTFVLHTGGVSFGPSKSEREREAVEKLRRMHPSYDGIVHNFVAADPPRAARLAVDIARIRARGLVSVLAVLHDRSGGTLRHVGELAQHLRQRAVFFTLTPAPGSAVRLELLEPGAGFRMDFTLPADWRGLLEVLRGLGIAHVHYHHLLGHRDEILHLGEQLGVPWDFTAHDYYSMCPQISLTDERDRFCGEQGDGGCRRCVPSAAAPGGLTIAAWRERNGQLLMRARNVLAPSRDTASRLSRMFPEANVRLAPHTDIDPTRALPAPQVTPLAPDAPLKVVVIGALSRIKGADVLEDVAVLAARAGAGVEFHLLGYAYRDLRKQPHAALTVHGGYEESSLPRLLDWIKPDLIWFPALWPETYSYTLSACLEAGLPVVAPNLGAFPERLSGRRWSWVEPWDQSPTDWFDFFVRLRREEFTSGRSPMPPLFATLDAAGADAPWSYETDYLNGVRPAAPAVAPHQLIRLAPTGPAAQSPISRVALRALVRMRSSSGLRQVARIIPHRWQGRVKSWLLK